MQHDLRILKDPIAELLDDMAAMGEHWAKNRERGRTPDAIRRAMLMAARDLVVLADHDAKLAEQQLSGMANTAGCWLHK